MMRVTSILLLAGIVHGNQLDTVLHRYLPASGCSCLAWTDPAAATAAPPAFWASKAAQSSANSSCAMPANANPRSLNYIPWCVCGGAKPAVKPCTAPMSVPEQINLVLAAADVVVVGFVTYEDTLPGPPPLAILGDSRRVLAGRGTGLSGVAHWYTTSHSGNGAVRNYTMNFVRFTGLKPRQRYFYKVRSGADASAWSDVFSFRAPYGSDAAGPTRIAIYGDMGNSQFNNVGNLVADCQSGAIDAIMHMGDHAYNMGDTGDHRGDTYMNAFSAALANCPWIPVIGNHESTECPHDEVDESTHERYLNQTWGAAYGQNLSSTATSALGHLLT